MKSEGREMEKNNRKKEYAKKREVTKFGDLSDEQIAVLAQEDDQEALEFFIRKYMSIVKKKKNTYFIMGAESDDVVQEGTIGLFKAIKSYDKEREASFSTFAEICVNRQILSAIKAASRMKHFPLNNSLSLSSPAEETEKTLEDVISSRKITDPETLIILKDVFGYISKNEGKLFSELEKTVWSEYVKGKSYVEISQKLGKSQKAVYNAMERMKKKIILYLG